MAHRAIAIARHLPSITVVVLVLMVTLGATVMVALHASIGRGLSPADLSAIRFTVSQAIVSALVSVALAVPTARALARRRFFGRNILISLLGAPFLLPVIVAIIGLLSVFGRSGVLNQLLELIGLPPISIYGFQGVVLAHVFFNLPLATRLILQGWLAVPSERYRLAATLNAPIHKFIERPMLRQTVPGAFLVVFLICLTSFAVALTLGGGPRATTVELAIYQALRFDFDLGRAALLACIQFVICAGAALVAWQVTLPDQFGAGLDRTVQRWDASSRWDLVCLVGVALFLLVPLCMIVLRGAAGLVDMPTQVWDAALRSIGIAVVAALLSVSMAVALAHRGGGLVTAIGMLPLAASSLVIGTGLFLLVFPFIQPAQLALPITTLVNAIFALPFVLRIVAPAIDNAQSRYGRLADSLGLQGWARMRLLVLPRIRPQVGFAVGLAAALAMGDLGVIALFAGEAEATLPLVMYRLMGAYRMDQAASAALLLVAISFTLFWLCDYWGRRHADT